MESLFSPENGEWIKPLSKCGSPRPGLAALPRGATLLCGPNTPVLQTMRWRCRGAPDRAGAGTQVLRGKWFLRCLSLQGNLGTGSGPFLGQGGRGWP